MRIRLLLTTLLLTFATAASAATANRCELTALTPVQAQVTHAIEAQDDAAVAAPLLDITPKNEGAKLVLDDKDLATISSRITLADKVVSRLAKADAAPDLGNTEAQLEFLKKNQAFRRFFKVKNSIARDLEQRDDPFDAQIKFLENQADGLTAKLEMIRQAKHTVDLSYFIFFSDTAGLSVLHEIKEAVRRGVRVRLLVDGVGSLKELRHSQPFKALLQDAAQNAGFMIDENGNPTKVKAGVEVVVFNPVTNILSGDVNRRSHDKMMVIDAMYPQLAMAILGGRNIADDYYADVDSAGHPMIDYEIIVKNALGSDIAHESDIGKVLNDYFERLYFHDSNRRISRDLLAHGWSSTYLQEMEKAATTVTARANGSGFSLNEGFHSEQMEFVSTVENILRRNVLRNYDKPDRIQAPVNGNSLTRRMRELFLESSAVEAQTGQAEHATLLSPYLMMSPNEMKLMIKWLATNPGRKLTIITSSILTNNHLMSQVLVDQTLAKLMETAKAQGLDSQIDIYCYGRLDDRVFGGDHNYGTVHEKSFALEQARVSAVVTYNGDARSMLLNSESGAILRGEHSYALRAQHFNDLIKLSIKYDSPEWHEMRERVTGARAKTVQFESQIAQTLRALGLWYMI